MRRKAWVFVFLVGAMALLVAGIAIWVRQRAAAGRAQIDLRLNAIRAAGEPATIKDLSKRYPSPPPPKDAALLLGPALDFVTFQHDVAAFPLLGESALPPASESLDETLKAELDAYLRACRRAFNLVRIEDLEGAWVSVYDGLDSVTSGQVARLRRLSLSFLLSAVAAAEIGDASTAIVQWKSGLIVARVVRNEPLIYQHSRRYIESQSAVVLERIVSRAPATSTEFESLDALLADEDVAWKREILLGIRCRDIAMLEQLRADPVANIRSSNSSTPAWLADVKSWGEARLYAWSHPYRVQDHTLILDTWERVFYALNQLPPSLQDEVEGLTRKLRDQIPRKAVCTTVLGHFTQLTGLIARDVEAVARLRTARVALAILRWRAAHEGKLPDSLAELVPDTLPAIPADPFDEQPLRYRRLPQGFTVYSVGPDFTDNGGQRQPAGTEKPDGYDEVFTVER